MHAADVPPSSASPRQLERRLGLLPATSLNIANMVGIGPFITIPLFISSMGGPQALIAWVIAAVLVICDGLVWSELGAALPGSGGTYHFFRQIFGRYRWGGLLPFLFIWQFLISGTLEIASGYIGAADYVRYLAPGLETRLANWGLPNGMSWLAAAAALIVTLSLCRPIATIGRTGVILAAGTVITVLTVIVAGLANLNPELLALPEDAFRLDRRFAAGLGAAMLIAIYDYLGYYNVCHLGDEIRDPGRTIPRAVMISVVVIAAIYLTMNLSIIAVVPWQKAMVSKNIAAEFMEQLYGRRVATAFTLLILWTFLACMFAITLGYSRILYAAARQGDFFRPFAALHPVHNYPWVALLAIGVLTAVFCFFSLGDVITAAVTVRILVQFVGQIGALHLLRTTRPDVALPFRMWCYPVPSLIAFFGWLFVLVMQEPKFLIGGAAVIVSGLVAFALWRAVSRSW